MIGPLTRSERLPGAEPDSLSPAGHRDERGGACASRARQPGCLALPVVLFPDGTQLAQPTHMQIAEKVGLETRTSRPFYDLIVVGAGPAGLAAAVYGASEGLCTALIERKAPGGQAGTSSRIENYLIFAVGIKRGSRYTRSMLT